jgi:transaldolase
MNTEYKSPLHETISTSPTDFWNDSCSVEELTYAIEHGAVGATTNPTIVMQVLDKEMDLWRDRIQDLITNNPEWSEDQLTWKLIEEVAVRGAELLKPVYDRENGKKGRISIQTHPAFYRNAEAIIQQAIHFDSLAPNMQIKIPATKAGITAIEEATRNGANINATVCFSVPQSLAVAEAVERGLDQREADGRPTSGMSPVCTIMIGRLDDWMHVLAKRDGIIANPASLHWAGVAALKKAYGIFQQRGYRARLLGAAYRHHLHWSELIGGDIILTIPYEWQQWFNASDVEVKDRMVKQVDEETIDDLYRHFPDFRRAYDEDGLTIDEFDSFGPTVRTLRGFISSYHDLVALVRDFMLPNPDIQRSGS